MVPPRATQRRAAERCCQAGRAGRRGGSAAVPASGAPASRGAWLGACYNRYNCHNALMPDFQPWLAWVRLLGGACAG